MRTVIVKQLPDALGSNQEQSFWLDLKSCMNVDRPFLVLDCSRLGQIDKQVVHLLLQCLEEALKRNGDVRLAGASAAVREMLESSGASRLFTIFDSSDSAVESFHALCREQGVRKH